MRGQRIYTEAAYSWNGRSYELSKSTWYEYAGAIDFAKGDGTARATLNSQDQLEKQSFDLFQQRQNQVSDAVSKYLSGQIGYDPAMLAAMKSQFLNQNAAAYNQAGRNVRTALLRSGSLDSSVPAGGDATRGIAALEGAQASNASQGIANINMSNLQQMLVNQFNAANLINGQAGQLTNPISTFGSGVNNSLNAYVNASNTGFGSAFTNALGRAAGNTLGGGNVSFTGTKSFG